MNEKWAEKIIYLWMNDMNEKGIIMYLWMKNFFVLLYVKSGLKKIIFARKHLKTQRNLLCYQCVGVFQYSLRQIYIYIKFCFYSLHVLEAKLAIKVKPNAKERIY